MSSGQPTLFLLSASHQRTPIELREKLALTADKMAVFQQKLHALPGLREFAVLNTCNRVEFYGVAETPDTVAALQHEFCVFQGFAPDDFARIRQQAAGPETIRHLIEVSAGLDSQMLGENEIFGQVKDAYAAAQERRTVGPVLNRVFQKAFQAAKHVRTSTAITEGQISVANVAVDLALKIFGNLSAARVLLLGAGDIGEKTAKAFQSRGASTLTVASRTLERAMQLASELDGTALPFEHLDTHLHSFDVVVCSTSAPHAVVTKPIASAAMKRRPVQPLFFIDLALPRDVDAGVANLENVFVYNLDDLAKIAEENRAARAAEVARARVIVSEKTDALWRQVERQCSGGPSGTGGQLPATA
ncbi:MAG TPA: glutamyl-tRNA reductase [Opitutaceae bacterium]